MKTGEFEYKVLIEVEFTEQELEIIEACAIHHYDGRVKKMVGLGGFFYGWMNRIRGTGDRRITCSPDQLDTCAKAIEMPTSLKEDEATMKARCDLQWALRDLMKSMGAEWERIHQERPIVGGIKLRCKNNVGAGREIQALLPKGFILEYTDLKSGLNEECWITVWHERWRQFSTKDWDALQDEIMQVVQAVIAERGKS